MFLLINILIVSVLKKWLKKYNWGKDNCLGFLIDQLNSFSIINDSKYIGLIVFMISNYFTGILNIFFNLHLFSLYKAFFCLCLNSFISSLFAYTLYFGCKISKK